MEIEKVTFDKTLRVTSFYLAIIGIRPPGEYQAKTWFQYFIKNAYFLLTFNTLFTCAIGELIWLILDIADQFSLLTITAQLPCVLFCTMGLYKLVMMSVKRNEMADIVEKLREKWPTKVNGDEEKEIVEKYMNMCILITSNFSLINIIMVSAFTFLPIIEMYYNRFMHGDKHRQVPFNIWFPFDQFVGTKYYFVYVYHVVAGFIVVIGNFTYDCLFSITIGHLCMHFQLLQRQMETFYVKNEEINEELKLKDKEIMENLKLCIKQHIVLIEFKQKLEKIFSDVIFFNFFTSSVVICLAGFQITTITGYNLVKFLLFIVCFIMELYILCWYGEQLLENSSQIRTSAYSSLWYDAPLKCQKMIIYIIHRTEIPCILTALKLWIVTMDSFSRILSASWSYFTLLKTVYKELPNQRSQNHGL